LYSGALGYTIRSFPKQSIDDYFTVNYYDYYPEWDASIYYFRGDSSKIDSYNGADGSKYYTKLNGQITGRNVKVPQTGKWLQTIYFYDDKYRVIQTVSNNHLIGGSDIASTKYDFTGKVMETRNEQHVKLRGTIPFALYYHTYNSYDHAGRLLKIQQRIAGDSYNKYVTLDSLKYNELGQLIEKNLHGKLQSIDYKYNIRGWLQSINNPDNLANDGTGDFKPDLFAMKLLYNDTIGGLSLGDEKQYNGNIAAVKWRLDQDATTKGYAYRYDCLNRILRANFGLAKNNWNSPQYDVTGRVNGSINDAYIQYDKNGNITSMACRDSTSSSNGTMLDNLHYRYAGNQLMSLGKNGNNASTTANTYSYYPSGNLQRDEFKNINVSYNELNLPSKVDFGDDNYIDYLYDANGVKLRKEVYINNENTTSTDYLGNIAYTDGAFDYLITGEGRVTKPSGNFVYEYHLKDHLGNTRVAFEAISSTSLNVTQRADYYPFGLQFKSKLSGTSNNKYLYNGKEMQDDVIITASLNWLDYGARFYDPQLGRWTTKDPLMEWHFNSTPYSYCFNNPISLIDPFGLDTVSKTSNAPVCQDDVVQGTNGSYATASTDEGTVSAAPMSGIRKVWRKTWRAVGKFLKGGVGTVSEGGLSMSSSIGQGTPDKAKNTEDIGNIDVFMTMAGRAGAGPFSKNPLDFAKGVKRVNDIVKENSGKSTSDKEIIEQNTGITPPNGDRGQPIDQTSTETNYWINQSSDTISVASGDGRYNGDVYYPGDTIGVTVTKTEGVKTIVIKDKKYPSR
jgi:RHS repeat-associated protein